MVLRAVAGLSTRCAVLVTAALVAMGASVTGLPAAEASTPAPAAATKTVLSVSPREALTDRTPVSFSATVTPGDASGYVRFTTSGKTLASAPIVDGVATALTVFLPMGVTSVSAAFSPTDPSRFAPSESPETTLRVSGVPNVWVTTAAGAVIPGSAPVTAGRSYVVNVSGFSGGSIVAVRLGSRLLVPGIRSDASGSGSLPLDLPASFAPGVYTLTASVGEASTAVAFYVIPTAVATTPPATTSVTPPTADAPPADTSQNPAPALADTGGEPLALVALGLLLLVLGALLRRWGTVEVGRRELRV